MIVSFTVDLSSLDGLAHGLMKFEKQANNKNFEFEFFLTYT